LPPFFSTSFPKEDISEKNDGEPPNPKEIQKTIARYAKELGGFDKVRKLTILQARLLSEVIAEEQLFQAKIHGCEVEEKEKVKLQSFSDAFKGLI
jgi:phosphoserine aminotransferase